MLNAANGANVRTVAQADATRPVPPGPNGFRRIDILTNEGRFWYEGVRVGLQHRTAPLTLSVSYTRSKAEDRLNHWFSPEDSSDPELDRGPTGADTPHNLVIGASWNIPGSGPVLGGWRLSGVSHSQSGTAYSLRYAGDPTGTTLNQCSNRGCQVSRPGARNTERGEFINYVDITLARTFAVGPDRIEFRADMFNVLNNQNLISDGYIGVVGNRELRAARRRVGRLPRTTVPVRHDVSLLTNRMRIRRILGVTLSPECGGHRPPRLSQSLPRVRVQTELGDIVIEVDTTRAPITAANFLSYVDAGHYDGGMFHRTVKMDNQPESTIKIEVIQAGVNPDRAKDGFPPIALERTNVTGILHKDGVVSMARGAPDSATSGWFICINDQPSLDFGGLRNPDGQGFAAFGRVVSGMDVVRKIQMAPSSSDADDQRRGAAPHAAHQDRERGASGAVDAR